VNHCDFFELFPRRPESVVVYFPVRSQLRIIPPVRHVRGTTGPIVQNGYVSGIYELMEFNDNIIVKAENFETDIDEFDRASYIHEKVREREGMPFVTYKKIK